MKFIRGRTRNVVLIGKLAIKFPNWFGWRSFLLGLQESMRERDFDKYQAKSVNPIIFSIPGGWLNVFPRVDYVFSSDKDPQLVDYFKMVLDNNKKKNGVEALVLDVIEVAEPRNYGIINGKVVCIDYGNIRNAWLNNFLIRELTKSKDDNTENTITEPQ